jgi:DNA-binding beta-propeller fold protein YncE
MRQYKSGIALVLFGWAFGFAAATAAAAQTPGLYAITRSIPLGSPDRWDYLSVDAGSHRVYVTHGSAIDVLDTRSGATIGRVDVPGANGVAVVASINRGYAGSSIKKAVLVFDLTSFKVLKELPADEDTDAVVFDPASARVFVMEGDPGKVAVVDTNTDTLVAQIALSGKPEFAAADGAGNLFINITDKKQIQRVNARAAKVTATWSINDCERPHGLAIDAETHRLFSTCMNAKMLIVDSNDGRIVATLPIGMGTDAAAFDASRRRAFSSNRDGTLSVIGESTAEHFVSLGDVTTQPLAKTMALDPDTGRIFLVAAERVESDSKAPDPRRRFGVRAGSVRLLFVDPLPN